MTRGVRMTMFLLHVQKVLHTNRSEITIRSSARSRRWASRRWPCTPRSTVTRFTSARADRPMCSAGRSGGQRSYLNVKDACESVPRIKRASRASRLRFLAENAPLRAGIQARDAGVAFIGRPASAIEAMGCRTRARASSCATQRGRCRDDRARWAACARPHRRRSATRWPSRQRGRGRRGLPRGQMVQAGGERLGPAPRARA